MSGQGEVERREKAGERWKLKRCSESMCLSHLHPLGSMFFNLISQPGLCVAVYQWQRLKVRSSFRGLSRNTSPVGIQLQLSLTLNLHIRPLCSAEWKHSECVRMHFSSKTYTHSADTLITLMHTHYGSQEYLSAAQSSACKFHCRSESISQSH